MITTTSTKNKKQTYNSLYEPVKIGLISVAPDCMVEDNRIDNPKVPIVSENIAQI